jgi:maleate cis-trans isomerase
MEIMTQRTLIGMLTPSSNTVLEPVTSAMLAGLPEVSAHFGRFRVTEIALSEKALAQFDDEEILGAAALLADGSGLKQTNACAAALPNVPVSPPAPRCSHSTRFSP